MVLGFLEVSRQFGDNKHLEFEAFSRTHHVLKIAASMEQQFLEHAVFHKTLRVPKSHSPLTVEIQSKRPVALTSSLPCGPGKGVLTCRYRAFVPQLACLVPASKIWLFKADFAAPVTVITRRMGGMGANINGARRFICAW